ncbi:MAG TPA: MBL fold metallo-hydrolase [Lacunisphaera sp.]|nr:MBL fold metallo-hydrolase [Lacunisphaera sp.]
MHMFIRWFRPAVLLLAAFAICSAQDLYVRVIDVGQGECVVAKFSDPAGTHYLIYDAGVGKAAPMKGILDVIPKGSDVDLMVISHNDSDHIGAVPAIMADYHVKKIIHPGDKRDSTTWENSNRAIRDEIVDDGCINLDLSRAPIAPGTVFPLGGATVTFVEGHSRPPAEWEIDDEAESNNAGSVVVRLAYEGKSILLCGDEVGRHRDSPAHTCIDAERAMVDNMATVPIASDVIVAPHHGANNASSEEFIAAVRPTYVIFSAGHSSNYKHPSKAAAERYLAAGITTNHIFRTDLGDDEGPLEWDFGRIKGNHDPSGDDDVEVRIAHDGTLAVAYRH